jgi:hypothetical protein
MVGHKWVGHYALKFVVKSKIILTELSVKVVMFFSIPIGTRKHKCMSLVLWGGALTLPKPKLYSTIQNPTEQSKGGSCCVYGWVGDDLKSVSRNKVPPEIGLSQMPTLTESCPSVECRFPNARCQFLIGPFFFLFPFSFCTHEETNKSRV